MSATEDIIDARAQPVDWADRFGEKGGDTMEMSGMGMVGCVVAYLVPLILLIVILVKVNRIAKVQDRSGPQA